MMRGIEAKNEIDPSRLLRDTRTLGQRCTDFLEDPTHATILLFLSVICVYEFPAGAIWIFIVSVIYFIYAVTRKKILPFRLPKITGIKDYNDLMPGTGKPNTARGIAYFGIEKSSNKELWFANEDMRTHVLIFGSTGSGKTETLVSLAFNALAQGSGFIYVDGKGDNALYAKIFGMVRGMGREDDLLLINFMTGARDIIGPQEKRLSNTLNPFCQGSSSMLTQLVVSLMGDSKGGGDGDMWKGRAISFVEALMRLLVYMRDQGAILLDANSIRDYFDLVKLEAIVVDKVFPREEQESVSIESIPKLVTDPLRNYVYNLPGYNKEKKGKQVSQVLEQHGFITMQLGRTFSSLADTYGHIIRTNLAEVDFKDVILNRRILVVLLPALEKSPDELSNLGKIIVSSLKAMLASGLGDSVEGDYRDVIDRKPTNAPTPFMCVLDEYGYYAVQGFAVVPAQARSLGFSVIFAGQDLPAFQKASKEEAASIGANTNIKICMKLEDPTETWEFFHKTAGEAYVTKVDSFQTDGSGMTNTYYDTRSSSFEKRSRVDLLDLKEQVEGEAHIFFKSRIIRARMFYANPKQVKRLKVNQFLKIEPPADELIVKLNKQRAIFQEIIDKNELGIATTQDNEELQLITEKWNAGTEEDPIERGIAALLAFHKHGEPEPIVELTAEEEEALGYITIFTRLRQPEGASPLLVKDPVAFSAPILRVNEVRNYTLSIERMAGSKELSPATVANNLVKDIEIATKYPPDEQDAIDATMLAGMVDELCGKMKAAKETSGTEGASEEFL
ncbi:MAG: type IV secretion system DNA-binding domain-containing protein [Legionellaceae bacterium]|nr:type IV secretion system DNA-binding domain-containing protein [Legionellaceae bacterium]